MTGPAISVVLPVHNGGAFLHEAIESVLAQSFGDFELIVVDDGSTDDSPAIIARLAERDPRVVVVTQENAGLVAALNLGLSRAQAPLIARMDADDVCMPDRFAVQVEALRADAGLGAVGSFIRIIDRDGTPIRVQPYPVSAAETAKVMEVGCPLAHPSVMMRRDAVMAVGGYRAAFRHCEDYDLWMRMLELGYRLCNIPRPLLNYRMHGGNVSARHRQAQELGTAFILLARRARRDKLPDPTGDAKVLDDAVMDVFHTYYPIDVDLIRFSLRYLSIRSDGPVALHRAFREYNSLSQETRSLPHMWQFLRGLLLGCYRQRDYRLALCVLATAVRAHPRLAAALLWQRFTAYLRFHLFG